MQVGLGAGPVRDCDRSFALHRREIDDAPIAKHAEKASDVLIGEAVQLGHYRGHERVPGGERIADLERAIADHLSQRLIGLLEVSPLAERFDEPLHVARRETQPARDLADTKWFRGCSNEAQDPERARHRLNLALLLVSLAIACSSSRDPS